jgi:hypothetical protein
MITADIMNLDSDFIKSGFIDKIISKPIQFNIIHDIIIDYENNKIEIIT